MARVSDRQTVEDMATGMTLITPYDRILCSPSFLSAFEKPLGIASSRHRHDSIANRLLHSPLNLEVSSGLRNRRRFIVWVRISEI